MFELDINVQPCTLKVLILGSLLLRQDIIGLFRAGYTIPATLFRTLADAFCKPSASAKRGQHPHVAGIQLGMDATERKG